MAVAPEPDTTPAAAAPPQQQPESYRPLSILAVVGFSLAVLYAALVLLGGLFAFASMYPGWFLLLVALAPAAGALVGLALRARPASRLGLYAGGGLVALAVALGLGGLVGFSGTRPWPLHSSTWLIAVAALVLCWLARQRVAASEGTLAGGTLAGWGLGVGLFFALNYAAYQFSNTFAVRSQARQCAEEFIELLRKGDLEQAFLRTLPPRSRPSPGSDVRTQLEVAHNQARSPRDPGPFSSFCQADYVRMLQLGGDQATYALDQSTEQYARGGYEVGLVYRVSTPLGSFQLHVQNKSQEVVEGNTTRRTWHVAAGETGTLNQSQKPTEEGIDVYRTAGEARKLVEDWGRQLTGGARRAAYLYTLPAEERSRPGYALPAATGPGVFPAVGLVRVLGSAPGAASLAEGLPAALAMPGDWEERLLDTRDLWAGDRSKALGALKVGLSGENPDGLEVVAMPARVPLFRREGDRMTVDVDVHLVTKKKGSSTAPEYIFEGYVAVDGPVPRQFRSTEQYRITKVRLLRAQTAVGPEGRPGGR